MQMREGIDKGSSTSVPCVANILGGKMALVLHEKVHTMNKGFRSVMCEKGLGCKLHLMGDQREYSIQERKLAYIRNVVYILLVSQML